MRQAIRWTVAVAWVLIGIPLLFLGPMILLDALLPGSGVLALPVGVWLAAMPLRGVNINNKGWPV